MADQPSPPVVERRARPRSTTARWQTAITQIETNKIAVRGFPLDELMGRLNFADAVYLLLFGELPTPAIGKMMGALLVSSIDHGATPNSTMIARNVAATGAPLHTAVAAGILGFGPYHHGDVGACMRFLDSGLSLVRAGATMEAAAIESLERVRAHGEANPPGFGHRFHSRDPRTARLFQMALELELEGEHVRFMRVLDRVLNASATTERERVPINVDGAMAAICGDLGFDYELGDALFVLSRVSGLIAHAHEERSRQPRMRQIDPKDHRYDGPTDRRLPETRR